jgi:hypothetical protein
MDPRYRNPAQVAQQLEEDNRGDGPWRDRRTLWSARFGVPVAAVEQVQAALLGAGVSSARSDGAPDQVVVEFNPVLVAEVAAVAVAHGGVLYQRSSRIPLG